MTTSNGSTPSPNQSKVDFLTDFLEDFTVHRETPEFPEARRTAEITAYSILWETLFSMLQETSKSQDVVSQFMFRVNSNTVSGGSEEENKLIERIFNEKSDQILSHLKNIFG